MAESTSYTAFRVTHASHRHVHDTTVVRFVGPVPHGWLCNNRKRWYMPHSNYHRQTVAFRSERSLSVQAVDNGQQQQQRPKRWRAEADKNRVAQEVLEGECSQAMQAIAIADGQAGGPVSDAATQTVALSEAEEAGARRRDVSAPTSGECALHGDSRERTAADTHRSSRGEMTDTAAREAGALGTKLQKGDDGHSEVVDDQDSINVSRSTTSSSQPITADTLDQRPSTPLEPARPSLNVLSPLSDEASREPSSVSALSFVTAHESLPSSSAMPNEYFSAEDVEAVRDDDEDSDTGTVRPTVRPDATVSDYSPNQSSLSGRPGNNLSDSVTHPLIDKRASCLADTHDRGRMNNLVRFTSVDREEVVPTNVSGEAINERQKDKDKSKGGGLLRREFRGGGADGELIRSDGLLVELESSRDTLPSGYSESHARKVVRRVDMHWRELICTARSRQDGLIDLDFYKSRRLSSSKPYMKLTLDPRNTRANLYSTLDKTIVVSYTSGRGSKIFILRPRSVPISIEWLAYIRACLGAKPHSSALIRVPGLSAKLRIDLHRDRADVMDDDASDASDEGDIEIDDDGRILANGKHITGEYLIDACWRVLHQNKDWLPVLSAWAEHEKLGLCWRRYDRLEWAHGESAKHLIGSWAMGHSHELEFRPKEHYPTSVRLSTGEVMQEPSPVEGFAIRLTDKPRFGKVYYKRLYLCSYDGMLFYVTPSKAGPPPPPNEDLDEVVFDVDPYPLDGDHVSWLRRDVPHEYKLKRDKIASTEAARRVNNLQAASGYVDLADVVAIRKFRRDRTEDGKGVDFHAAEPETLLMMEEETGLAEDLDADRTFELVMQSGLTVRFQVYDGATCRVWMSQLDALARYWRLRSRSDFRHLQTMRQLNMEVLHIDADQECYIGQDASKWEVSRCTSDAQIYNFCQFSSCRTVALKGLLYRKPRTHSTFRRYSCLIAHGQLLVYDYSHWSPYTGTGDRATHALHQVVDLRGCYVYSGAVTVDELLNMNDASDRDGPGRHSLPRLYEDGWTTREEQESLCFVIWSSRKRAAWSGLDREDAVEGRGVARLGVEGKSMIYMTRSRQERDLWVQALNLEIERSCGGGGGGSQLE